MISTHTYSWTENDAVLRHAVTFAEIADEYRRGLRADRGEPSGVTRAEALVAAGMLSEFAHRLRQELAAGQLADEAAQLAGIAEEVSDRLRHPGRSEA